MRFTTLSNYHLIDWWCDVDSCLFTCWFDSRILLHQFDTGNRYYKQTDYPSVLVTPTISSGSWNIFKKERLTEKERREFWMLFCLRGRKFLTLEKELFLWETGGMQINHKRNFIQDSCQILSFHFKSTFHWPSIASLLHYTENAYFSRISFSLDHFSVSWDITIQYFFI